MAEIQWRMATIKFDLDSGKKKKKTRIKFKLIHNLPDIRGLNIEDALNNWIPRTEEHTAESFKDYINSKSHMTNNHALTLKDYELLKSNSTTDPNNKGGTGHYDESLSDADPGL